jgi:outer membrane protein assembly factor BamA
VSNLAILIFLTISLAVEASSASTGSAANAKNNAATDALNINETMKTYDGKIVRHIIITGLVRTKARAIRWIMKTTEGEPYYTETLKIDILALYNTANLYNIMADVKTAPGDLQGVDIFITLEDKWTLLPFLGAQGGGGSFTFGGGLYDSNVLGYFVNTYIAVYNYDGAYSYRLNANQEYIAGSQYSGSIDISNVALPTTIYRQDNSSAGNYTWQRNQFEIVSGYHFIDKLLPTKLIRVQLYSDFYTDSLLKINGVNASTYSGFQYRLQPVAIFGRSNIIEFFEIGHELTIQPAFANFFEASRNFTSLQLSYKNVTLLPNNQNLAFFIFGAAMTPTPVVYEQQVGGYSNVRGYSDARQTGPFSLVGNAEYRPYLKRFRLPIIEEVVIQGCVFTDTGSAWGDSTLTGESQLNGPNFLWSSGAGIRLNFLHFSNAITRFDIARTIRPDEGVGFSFGVNQFF